MIAWLANCSTTIVEFQLVSSADGENVVPAREGGSAQPVSSSGYDWSLVNSCTWSGEARAVPGHIFLKSHSSTGQREWIATSEAPPRPIGRPRDVCDNLLRSTIRMWSRPARPATCIAVFLNFRNDVTPSSRCRLAYFNCVLTEAAAAG